MDSLIISLLTIGGTLLLGAMNPGESFLLVARTTVANGRINGIATALSMGTGSFIFSIAALFGLQAVLKVMPDFYIVIRVLGGAYLIYLSWTFISNKKNTIHNRKEIKKQSFSQSYMQGLIMQLSNPNTALVFASVFSALLIHPLTLKLYLILPIISFSIDAFWYIFVAVVLSCPRPRKTYITHKFFFDVIASIAMLILGLKTLYIALSQFNTF